MLCVTTVCEEGAKNTAYHRTASFQSLNAPFYPVCNVDGTVPEKFPVTQKEYENIPGSRVSLRHAPTFC
jgi:hypothetical protein